MIPYLPLLYYESLKKALVVKKIVLLGACDAHYNLALADTGYSDRNSDGGVFSISNL